MSTALPAYGNRTPEQLKVSELRDELRRRGLQSKGLKRELIERLDEAIQKELQEQRHTGVAAQAVREAEAETVLEPDPVVELKPAPASPAAEPLPPVYDVPSGGPGSPSLAVGAADSLPPDLNLAPKEVQIESKEPDLGPKEAIQPRDSEAKTIEHAVEPETLPDSIPKVNSVPSPYPGGIEVSLHESLSEVPEVANSDANAEHTAEAEVNHGLGEDHMPEVQGETNVVQDYAVEQSDIETSSVPPVKLTEEELTSPKDDNTESLPAEAEPVSEVTTKVVEEIMTEVVEEVRTEVIEEVMTEAVEPETKEVPETKEEPETREDPETNEDPEIKEEVLARGTEGGSETAPSLPGEPTELDGSSEMQVEEQVTDATEVTVKQVDVQVETVEVVQTESKTGDEDEPMVEVEVETKTVTETVTETVVEVVQNVDELLPIQDEPSPSQDEHMAEATETTAEPVAQTASASEKPVEVEEAVPTESLLPEVIPGESAVLSSGFGKGSSESDEPRDLEERNTQAGIKEVKEGRTAEPQRAKVEELRSERRHDRGLKREPGGRPHDDRHRYDQRREFGGSYSKGGEERHRYERDSRRDAIGATGRRDDETQRHDDLRREPIGINQKLDEERQRASRRDRSDVRHSKEGHRERDDLLDDRSRMFNSSGEQRGKGEAGEVEDNGKGKDTRLMDIDTDALAGTKRKDGDQDLTQSEPIKRQRRWNSGKNLVEDVKVAPKVVPSDVAKDVIPTEARDGHSSGPPGSPTSVPSVVPSSTNVKVTASERAPASRPTKPDAAVNGEGPKQRVVPPSTKPSTTSLKIDRFLRPFTIKAVRDLLSLTGTIKDLWMDHIKTHCYVTYSSVEEAVATRDAVYNLQWPPHGGKLLVADFVEPEEVKLRIEGPIEKSAVTPVTTPRGPTGNNVPGAGGPPPTVTHPPPAAAPVTSHPSPAGAPPREKPSLPPKREPEPVPTLDDLFKKTRAKPHIYYLPLTEEQIAAKVAAPSKAPINKPPVRV